MNPYALPKRKLLELLIMLVLAGVLYIFYPHFEACALFVSGFIWNWASSIELDPIYENRRYRFSMLCTIRNIQKLFLKPFRKLPVFIQRIVAIFPAGIFWAMVIYMNESEMPWWATFVGSLAYEVMEFEIRLFRSNKGQV